MPTTYIPRPDADFSAFAGHFYDAVEKWWQVQGLNQTDLKPLKDALAVWDGAFPKHLAAQNAAEAARQTKDSARLGLEREVRPVANFIQTFPATTDADRATIGITVRQATGGTPRTPTSRPLVLVDAGDRLRHTIRFVDESAGAPGAGGRLRRARPKGTLGAEVRMVLTMCMKNVRGFSKTKWLCSAVTVSPAPRSASIAGEISSSKRTRSPATMAGALPPGVNAAHEVRPMNGSSVRPSTATLTSVRGCVTLKTFSLSLNGPFRPVVDSIAARVLSGIGALVWPTSALGAGAAPPGLPARSAGEPVQPVNSKA
jgi:hypothetical protein